MFPAIRNNILLMLTAFLLGACAGSRHLPKGVKLYTGATIKLESSEKIDQRKVKTQVAEVVRPKPNKVVLGLYPKLWLYNLAEASPHTKLGKWLQKMGEAPVLMSSVKPGVTCATIDAKLFNLGIFKGYTESKIIEKEHTARVIYTSHVHKPFVVKELIYRISNDSLQKLILTGKDKTLIKPGDDYNLELLKAERVRMDEILKNNGYYYFNPDYLLFKADTSNVKHDVSLRITLKDSIPVHATTVYRLDKISVNQDYSLNERKDDALKDTLFYKNVLFFGEEALMAVRPNVLSESIYLKKSELFSRKNHLITLNRLMSMGNFKLVQVSFVENKTASGLLDVNILMTPMPKRTFRAEVDLVSKSNNYAGPRMNLSILNRNTFNGAEILSLNLAGSFEAQISGAVKNSYSYSWSPQLELTFPRFLVPFKIKKTNSLYLPKTKLLLSYNYLKRVNYFDMNTFRFVYGFKWKENILKEHELNPVDISLTSVGNKSILFTDILESNPFLKKSYEEQFIVGGSYSFTYNEQILSGKKVQNYIHLASEVAGNLFSLAKIIGGDKISSEQPSTVVGSTYSQFAKLSFDGRLFYNLQDKNKLAFRLFAGVAHPFGNSSVMPYTRQFFSGGPNSIRAFQINSVGPGTFLQEVNGNSFLQMGGDVKLEMNSEYRFNIYKYFKGALFLDAGNVWLLKSNPSNTGSPFQFSTFMNQIAVGTGLGLRVDVSFFILRFDLAMPLRKPWLEEHHRWVADQISFGSSVWRRENLVLNVAIGYPF